MPAPFLVPALVGAAGALLGGKARQGENNRQIGDQNAANQYAVDQRRRDYEAELAQRKFIDEGKQHGIDFLGAVAQAKGFTALSPEVLNQLKEGGVFQGVDARTRFADAPQLSKQGFGSVLTGALGAGLSSYGNMAGQAALDRAEKSNTVLAGITGDEDLNPAGFSSSSELIDYYRSLLGNQSRDLVLNPPRR